MNGEPENSMTDVAHTTLKAPRRRLPNRRPSHSETLEVGGQKVIATVGFDPETGQPRELFMSAGKEGSLLNALLGPTPR